MDEETPTTPRPESVMPEERVISEPGKEFNLGKLWFIPVMLVLVALIVVGSLWVMNKGLITPKPSPAPTPSPSAEIDEDTAVLEEQGTSDEISDIEADLNATDLFDIDKELTDIDRELSSP